MGVVCLLGCRPRRGTKSTDVVDVEGGGVGADEEGLGSEGVDDCGWVDLAGSPI
jgi:hypothetical protein